ncbi:uncharacterized protein LOC135500620 [Lineus longissimus]|uniref:uncharacterized protein LOC135500620 n=1 Tax=Lineus longissimus TaxID=88925 RepID=UPI002B4CC4A4
MYTKRNLPRFATLVRAEILCVSGTYIYTRPNQASNHPALDSKQYGHVITNLLRKALDLFKLQPRLHNQSKMKVFLLVIVAALLLSAVQGNGYMGSTKASIGSKCTVNATCASGKCRDEDGNEPTYQAFEKDLTCVA